MEHSTRMKFLISFLLVFQFSSTVFAAEPAGISHEVQTYDQLVHAIRKARATSVKRVHQERVRLAWETGKLIDTHVFQHKERADYAKYVVIQLAKDLEMSTTELYYNLQFARTYPILPHVEGLTWSHYRELLSVNDPALRERLARQVVKENWDAHELHTHTMRINTSKGDPNAPVRETLRAKAGKVGIYRVIKASVGPYEGRPALDLGFSNYFRPKEMGKFKENDLVIFEKGKLKLFMGLSEDRYTYRAYVTEVIDADTFRAVIDLGFDIVTEQKLRLRGLDAPEIESAEGRESKAFLEKRLAKKGGPILIKTVKSDKYDRYLADVYVEGSYVNQELLDKELAQAVS